MLLYMSKNRLKNSSLAEQIHLLNFLANRINSKTSILNKNYSEEESLQTLRESSLSTVWESVKK